MEKEKWGEKEKRERRGQRRKERGGGGEEEEMKEASEQEEEQREESISVSSGCPSLPFLYPSKFCLRILKFCSYRP